MLIKTYLLYYNRYYYYDYYLGELGADQDVPTLLLLLLTITMTEANWVLIKTADVSNALKSQLRRNFGKLYASQVVLVRTCL